MPIVKMESATSTEGVPDVFLVPGIEGMAPVFEILAKGINANLYCLQYSMEAETIEEMGKFLYEVRQNGFVGVTLKAIRL